MYNVSFRGVLPTVACRCVWSSNLVREEAKARWRAVKYTPTMGCVAPGVEWGGEVQCTIVTCSRNHCCNGNATVCSLCVPELSLLTIYQQGSYSETLTPATTNSSQIFMKSARYFWPILTKFGFSHQIFIEVPHHHISRKTIDWELCYYMWTEWQT